jgi:hypothetical protein
VYADVSDLRNFCPATKSHALAAKLSRNLLKKGDSAVLNPSFLNPSPAILESRIGIAES